MRSSLGTLDRRSLKDSSVDQIRRAITRGELKSGERVTELGLARKLGVGQATIREALIELEHQGFILRHGLHKTLVTTLSRGDIDEIYQVRVRLEPLVMELLTAAKVRTVEESEQACKRMAVAARAGDVVAFCSADLDFHRGLWRAAGNRTLAEILERLVPRIFALDVIRPAIFKRAKLLEIAGLHSRLLELLRSGRWQAGRALTVRMMQQAWQEDSRLPLSDESSSV